MKYSRYTASIMLKSSRLARKTPTRTASASLAPAASAMAPTLLSAWRTWSAKSGGTVLVARVDRHLAGHEEQTARNHPLRVAPYGIGALSVRTALRLSSRLTTPPLPDSQRRRPCGTIVAKIGPLVLSSQPSTLFVAVVGVQGLMAAFEDWKSEQG